jgi:hypothetical protein
MMSFDWKSLVGSIAPTLATALGGPMAGMAVKALSSSMGLSDESTEKELSAALQSASPEILAQIQKADQDFALEMEKLGVDLEKIASDDRANARSREIATGDNAPKILACVVVVGFFTTLACVAFVDISAASQQPVNILLGALTALLIQVGNYYFGSSAGSKEKTQHLANKP